MNGYIRSIHATEQTYSPGGLVVVRTTVQNVGAKDSDNFTICYYLSPDSDVTTQDRPIGSLMRGGLAVGQQDSFDAACQLPPYVPQGKCYVGAKITVAGEDNTQNNWAADSTPVTLVHPARYVCGQAKYRDIDSGEHVIRCASVQVYQEDGNGDPLDDRVVAQTSTDAEGNYGVVIPGEDESDRQIYLKVFTQGEVGAYPGATSRICSVRDDVYNATYSLRSSAYPRPRDASLMANMTASYTGGEFMVYDSVVEGFRKAETVLGIEPNEIDVYWPSSDKLTYYEPNSGIHIAQGDRGDRDVIMHEYAHYVAQICSFAQGDVGEYPQHYWNLDLRFDPSNRTPERARNLAFREAWATLFSIATQYGETDYPYSGDTQYQDYDEVTKRRFEIDLETQTRLHSTPGEYFENMNCCALWDIFGDKCDAADNQDTLSDPCLARIWTIMRDDRPTDIKGFWDRWFTIFTNGAEMLRIFRDHGMEFPYIGPSMAVEDFETGDFSRFAWVRFLDQPWVITPDVVHQGKYSARAADVNDSQKSTLQIMMTVDDGPIKYWCKVSSELGIDKLQFLMDGIKKSELSGEVEWRQITCPVKAGSHTFTWTYVKNGAGSVGADTAWLDDIEFPVW